MKPAGAFFTILALISPTIATAQPQADDQASLWYAGQQVSKDIFAGIDQSAGVQKGEARASLVLARDVIVGPSGRVIERRGPRERGRVFSYHGRSFNVIRRPAFVYPRGFEYRRWGVGQLFPGVLLAAPFFFLEYEALGLRPPPPGYRWVRYGPDMLLVDMRSRRVVDVAYDVFDEE
jgi:Ni/Co efflux regulator RcnB